MSDSLVGLAISQSLILTGMVQHGMRQFADVVSQITSVERIMEYIKIEKEGNFTTSPGKPDIFEILSCNNIIIDQAPAEDWPRKGKINFADVSLYYVPTDPPVLKNLSFTIEPNQKVLHCYL